MKSILFVTFLSLGLVFVSCNKDDDGSCNTTAITYDNTAAAILDASCAVSGCHTDQDLAGMFSLEGAVNAKNSAGFGRLVGAINHSEGFSPMPPNGVKIPDCDIDQLTAWIDQGLN